MAKKPSENCNITQHLPRLQAVIGPHGPCAPIRGLVVWCWSCPCLTPESSPQKAAIEELPMLQLFSVEGHTVVNAVILWM